MSIRRFGKRLINRVTGRHERRARAEDARLLELSSPLPQDMLDDARLLTDRDELLRRLPAGGVVAEVGVARGAFSDRILTINKPSKLYLIDAWMMSSDTDYGTSGMEQVRQRFGDAIGRGTVELRRGWSWDKLAELEDGSLDWVYVDASHHYDAVRKDLEVAQSKVKPGGYICGHDYVRWARFGHRFGVVEAVNEFVNANGYKLEFLTIEPDYNASFAIRVGTDGSYDAQG